MSPSALSVTLTNIFNFAVVSISAFVHSALYPEYPGLPQLTDVSPLPSIIVHHFPFLLTLCNFHYSGIKFVFCRGFVTILLYSMLSDFSPLSVFIFVSHLFLSLCLSFHLYINLSLSFSIYLFLFLSLSLFLSVSLFLSLSRNISFSFQHYTYQIVHFTLVSHKLYSDVFIVSGVHVY